MKRIKQVMVAILLLLTVTGYSQFSEGFEAGSGPITTPSSGGTWTLSSGTWAIIDRGGVDKTWTRTTLGSSTIPPRSGNYAAYLDRDSGSPTPEDWLVTPAINVSGMTAPELTFYSRHTFNGVQGGTYKVLFSNTSQTDIVSFDDPKIVPVESDVPNVYSKMTVTIPQKYISQGNGTLYIAFVMIGSNQDRWLIDDVLVADKCLSSTNITSSNNTGTSIQLSWGTPPGVNKWEVQILDKTEPLTDVGTIVSTNTNYTLSSTTKGVAFESGKEYRAYVRSVCFVGNVNSVSEWVGPYFISMAKPGMVCSLPIVIPPTLPYISFEQKNEIGSSFNLSPGNGCGIGSAEYGGKPYTIYSYTAPSNGTINISVQPSDYSTAVFVYGSCNDIGVNCLAGSADDTNFEKSINNFQVVSGTTYYIVVATKKTDLFDYTIMVSNNTCSGSNTIQSTFNISGDCTTVNAQFTAVANITNLGGPGSVVASLYKNGTVVSSQTVTSPGTVSFTGNGSSDSVYILLQKQQTPACMLLSNKLSKKLCPPSNDNCATAQVLTPSATGSCNTVLGTLTGATASPELSTCPGDENNDVWYEFIAIGETHIISFLDLDGSDININHILYKGTACGSLEEVYCDTDNYSVAKNLIVGQTYKIRVYTDASTPSKTTFRICNLGYPKTCMDSNDKSATVKGLFIDLINYLKSLQGPYPAVIDCPQLTALAPYISDPNPRIYNFNKNNNGSSMDFSFSNHPAGTYDVRIMASTDLIATDLNFFKYLSPDQEEAISITYSDGSTFDKGCSVKHINFCPTNCKPIYGKIKIASTSSCIIQGSANVFSLQTTSGGIASYAWSFYKSDGSMNLISTSTLASPSMTFTENGFYFAKLIITGSNGCTTKYEKSFLVSDNCSGYCAETNPETETVKDIYINLINHLFEIYNAGGTVPSPYFCSELADLAPFITDAALGIYNAKYTNGTLSFSFGNHDVNGIDVMVENHGPITDINLSHFTLAGDMLMAYYCSYLNGDSTYINLRHVNFCPTIPKECVKLTGDILLSAGLSCIVKGTPTSIRFVSNNLKITGYNWTFTSFADGAVLSTSTLSRPVITYPEAFSGKVIVKLVVSHGINCTSTFYKIVNISTAEGCNTCTETNPKTAEVKKLVINLVNHFYNIYKNGGSVTLPYSSAETIALVPYHVNSYQNELIEDVAFTSSGMSIAGYSGFIIEFLGVMNAPLVDFEFISGTQYAAIFANGSHISNFTVYGINFCPDFIPCPPVTGDLKLGLGESCIPVSTAQSFEFTGSTANIASYAWTFYNRSGSYPLATSQSAKPSMTYNIEGSYLVKLEITSATGCKNSFYKTITVSANCGNDNGGGSDGSNGPNCTEVNGNALVVKQLYKTFLNSLLALNGSIPNGYTNAALTALLPYIADVNPKIYNVNYTDSVLSFSFSQGETQPDVVVANYGTIVDINLVNYTTTGNPDCIITYADGTQYTKHKAKHINFCPTGADVCKLDGYVWISSGFSCIPQGSWASVNFSAKPLNATYEWTFYNAADNTVLSTTTEQYPIIDYPQSFLGIIKIKLVIKHGGGCTSVFYKLIEVTNAGGCTECTETNPKTAEVKKIFIKLVNTIYNTYKTGGTIAVPYTSPETIALSTYFGYPFSLNIVNGNHLNFMFQGSDSSYFGINNMTAPIADFITSGGLAVFEDGNTSYAFISGFNFCPVTECLPLFGELKLGSGESCIAVNSPQSFHFTGNTANIASYAWTFYNKEGTFALLTSSFKMPYMTYNSAGDYLVKLEVTSTTGCKDIFYKTITVSANCGNNNDGGGDGSNGDNCTEVNPEAKTVKHLYMTFLNSLLPLNGNIPNGFSNMELSSLALYITDINPKIYNVNYTGNILSFSFSQSDTQPDVIMATNNGAIVDINLLSYTTTGNHNYILTYKNGVQYKTHKANHINFCPNLEPCKSHVAFVFDESSSFKGKDVDRLKIRMRDFVDQQVGSNMTVSFTGLSDSDTYNRTDHIYGKITAENKAVFYTWIDNYKSGYSGRSIGVSPNSDYWASGLKQAMNGYELKPEIVILFTDGSQTADVPGLKQIVSSIINDEDSHLYVYGIDSGFYVSDTAIPLDPNNYINTDISDVTPRLKSSIKFLMGLHPDEFPANSKDDLLAGVYFGYENFDHLELDDRFFSNKLTQANIGCGGEVILKDFCYDCQTFQPSPGQTYWISAWAMEEQNVQVKTYTNAVLKIIFLNQAKTKVGEISLLPSGDIIDGWQRFASKVEIPETATIMEIELENLSPNIPVYFDDIRVHPINGSMKSFVYDPETFRLMAEQDDNNYSTFYEYDQEGGLIRIKKETSKGIKTIQESRSGSVIKQVGN